jgi:prophage regulatory protein
MVDRVLIPLPGIGTLSLTKAEYEAALVPIEKAELPQPSTKPPAPPPPSAVHAVEHPPRFRYIRLKEVCVRVGLRSSSIYRLIHLDRFPKQVKLSERSAAWIESEVEAFMLARAADRDSHLEAVVAPESPYMRMGEVMRRTGLSASAIYDFVRTGEFPKWADLPKIASGWVREEVEGWMAERGNKGKRRQISKRRRSAS